MLSNEVFCRLVVRVGSLSHQRHVRSIHRLLQSLDDEPNEGGLAIRPVSAEVTRSSEVSVVFAP
jgi:hypothetical protein